VREATESDLPALVKLLAQLAPNDPAREAGADPLPYAYHLSYRRLTECGGNILVLDTGERIVGTLALYIVPNISHHGSPFAIVENVVVDGGERSRGYGKLLMERAAEIARERGAYKISLTSNKRRNDAHRFYAGLGYKQSHAAFRLDL
jgi:GNAT superfamily N-acetyltransferase